MTRLADRATGDDDAPDGRARDGIDPDFETIRRIADGHGEAVAVLVDKYLVKITNNAYRILGNRDDADEVAQDVFLRVWKHAPAWKPDRAKFSTWIYRVTVNLCVDRVRKRRETVMANPPDQMDDRPLASDLMEQDQMASAVREALQQLPPRQSTALSLCYFDNLSNQEAADIMQVSVDALESLLARGRRGLHQRLSQRRDVIAFD